MSFLNNTDIVVAIAFVVFLLILLKAGVPKIIGKTLDDRSAKIRSDIDEARSLREEAQTLLASYERKQEDVKVQAERIIATAREEAEQAAEDAKAELKRSIERRMAAAEDQISSAETHAVNAVRNQAATIAVAAAQQIIGQNLSTQDGTSLIDDAIKDVDSHLH